MKRSRLLAVVAVVALVRVTAAQDLPPLMVPTPEHMEMAREVGVWEGEAKLWPAADAEPVISKGKETVKLLGQMWLVGQYEGDMMGMPFHGQSQLTYDPMKKKYVGTWIDSLAPVMMTMTGDYDAQTNTLTMMMEGIDAMTGKPGKWKSVTRYESEDAKTFEMYMPVEGQDGKWWKMMEIKYQRQK